MVSSDQDNILDFGDLVRQPDDLKEKCDTLEWDNSTTERTNWISYRQSPSLQTFYKKRWSNMVLHRFWILREWNWRLLFSRERKIGRRLMKMQRRHVVSVKQISNSSVEERWLGQCSERPWQEPDRCTGEISEIHIEGDGVCISGMVSNVGACTIILS